MTTAIEVHPVQVTVRCREQAVVPKVVTMKAYEVYCHVYGKQEALVTGSCRGGFGVNELIAFLYASTYPQSEWKKRVEEAFTGMRNV